MNLINFIPISIKPYLKRLLEQIKLKSLSLAIEKQGLKNITRQLALIVPDITKQYSMFDINTPYLEANVRGLHAFQISLVEKIIDRVENPVIVDIGDSSGTHLQYIKGLYSQKTELKCLSVNLDAKAIEKIRKKGLEAIHARAEDLSLYNIKGNIFLCFEMLEHLMNPCYFLHELSSKTQAEYLIITVPYLKISRVGMGHIRAGHQRCVCAENTHIFELNPEDWKLLIKHSGWDIVEEKIYFQYPRRNYLWITKYFWRKYDYEGFYGLILKRDKTWSSKYQDW